MAENRFTFTTDDPELAAEIIQLMNPDGADDTATATAAAPKSGRGGRKASTAPAAPTPTAPPAGVPTPAPIAAPPAPAAPVAPPAPAAPPPTTAPVVAGPPGWSFEDHIKPAGQVFVGKYSAADMKKGLQEHFGVDALKDVPGHEWPRLHTWLTA